jgi:hypothetical protein
LSTPAFCKPVETTDAMIKEVNIFGIYLAPFVLILFLTFIVFIPVRIWFDRVRIQQWVWHRPLFDLAVFVILLSTIGLLFF